MTATGPFDAALGATAVPEAKGFGHSSDKPRRSSGPFKTAAVFCREYEPISYVVEPLVRSSSLYTLTANTGDGKTGLLISMALGGATGRGDLLN